MIRCVAVQAVITYCFASIIALGIFLLPASLCAQDSQSEQTPAPPDAETGPATDSIPVMFPRLETDRLWISAQANIKSRVITMKQTQGYKVSNTKGAYLKVNQSFTSTWARTLRSYVYEIPFLRNWYICPSGQHLSK